jgi:hypothetical protein
MPHHDWFSQSSRRTGSVSRANNHQPRVFRGGAEVKALMIDEKARIRSEKPLFSITDLAERWCCSRASVYNRLRGEEVVDFAANGKKGSKLVPLHVVLKIEREHLRVLR